MKPTSTLCAILLLLFATPLQAQPPVALEGRLIKLEVRTPEGEGRSAGERPEAVARVIERFLTERGFVLMDDEAVVVMRVEAYESIGGSNNNPEVSYVVEDIRMDFPGGGRTRPLANAKNAPSWTSESESQARSRAASLLRDQLSEDELLSDALARVPRMAYFEFRRNGELAELRNQLEQVVGRLARIEGTTKQLLSTARGHDRTLQALRKDVDALGSRLSPSAATGMDEIEKQIDFLTREMHDGFNRISQKTLAALAAQENQIRRAIRAARLPFIPSGRCGSATSAGGGKMIGMVMICVPTPHPPLSGANIKVFAANDRLVDIKHRVFPGGWDALEQGSCGNLIKAGQYLLFHALEYHHEEGAVIIDNCDAEMIVEAFRQPLLPDDKGRLTSRRLMLLPGEGCPEN